MIYTHIAAALLGAAIAATGAWQVQNWRMGEQIATLKAGHSAELAQATAEAKANQDAINAKYQGALNAARTREAQLRTERDRLNAVSDSLRTQAADAARRLADAPAHAVLEYASAVNSVYDDCRRRYGALADKAAGHAADVRTLTESWPVTPTEKAKP